MEPSANAAPAPKRYVVSLSGANRLGALAAVSNALSDLGGNMVEVRQTVVDKFFNMLLSADFPESRGCTLIVDHITDTCRAFNVQLHIFDPALEQGGQPTTSGAHPLRLLMKGPDQPGTLQLISARLAQCGVDVIDVFAARCETASTFDLRLRIAVPESTDQEALEGVLNGLGAHLTWELQEV